MILLVGCFRGMVLVVSCWIVVFVFVADYLVVGLIVVWFGGFGFVVVGVCWDLLGCCIGVWCGWRVLCSEIGCLVLVLLGLVLLRVRVALLRFVWL